MAELTENYVSADLELIVNDAARIALSDKSRNTMAILETVIANTQPSLTKEEIKKNQSVNKKMQGNRQHKTLGVK